MIDGRKALVTSANFTEAAQERNIELGLLVNSPAVASQIEGHFYSLNPKRSSRKVTITLKNVTSIKEDVIMVYLFCNVGWMNTIEVKMVMIKLVVVDLTSIEKVMDLKSVILHLMKSNLRICSASRSENLHR